MIKLINLTKCFNSLVAVNDLSLEIKQGEIFGFLGPNGAGKTTTIRMMAGLIKPTSGTVIIDAWTLHRTRSRQSRLPVLSPIARTCMGSSPDENF